MAAHNRYLRGKQNQIRGTVDADVVIEAGDFVVLNNQDGTVFQSSYSTANSLQANNFFYPFTKVGCSTAPTEGMDIIASNFAGIAMTGSASGVTNQIVVATTGVFRYPLYHAPSAVTIGSFVSAVSPPGGFSANTGVSKQTVVNHATLTGVGTTAYLGYVTKTESGASYVDFELWSGLYEGRLA